MIVDDNESRRAAVADAVSVAGFVAHSETEAGTIVASITSDRPDLVLLVLEDQTSSGLALARSIRSRSELPIIMLVASGAVDDRLAAFQAGVDDCLDAPFATAELVARMVAVLRRSQTTVPQVLRVGDLTVDLASAAAARAGNQLDLTPKEFALLAALAEKPGVPLSAPSLRRRLWPDAERDTVVQTHVSILRRKLEAYGPRILHSVRCVGYMIRAD